MTSGAIEVRGLRLLANVGVPEAERLHPQPLSIDLELTVDLDAAGRSDDVADTVDYGAVAVAVAAVVTDAPAALLERVASLVADAVLDLDGRTEAVTVTITKLRPPIPLDVEATSVRLHRSRA